MGRPWPQRSFRPSSPSALTRITQSRTACRSMPASRADSARLIPSSALAIASRRRATRGFFSCLARRRSSRALISVRIGKAGMAHSPAKPCPSMNHQNAALGIPFPSHSFTEAVLHIARRHNYRIVEATALRLLAVSESRLSHSAAEQRFQEALLCSKSLGLGPEIAHCRFGHAISLARMDRFREAYRELTDAADLYGDLRMEFWRQRALLASKDVGGEREA